MNLRRTARRWAVAAGLAALAACLGMVGSSGRAEDNELAPNPDKPDAPLSAFDCRSGMMPMKLLKEKGGVPDATSAVARGIKWLALHQAADGHWSLNHFEQNAHAEPSPDSKTFVCTCTGQANRNDDIAATGFGLLPFLGAGNTHKPLKHPQAISYEKTVKAGLEFLISKQGADGYFGGSMYSHAIATIALCEAYGMTADPSLEAAAQKAIQFIEAAQDPDGGGWRYAPKMPGDLSVTGWQLMALKTAQMAGLELSHKGAALKKASVFLESVESANQEGGYVYMPGAPETPTMTAVGMLCRQYLGSSPRNPRLLMGVEKLEAMPPGKSSNTYYLYYATWVMFNMGGDAWNFWNEGPDGKGSHTGFRDALIAQQDTVLQKLDGLDKLPCATLPLPEKLAHEDGSWEPDGAWAKNGGGRIVDTSLSLLTLEVYYRHYPLYRQLNEDKDK